MCVVSMVIDHYRDKWYEPISVPYYPYTPTVTLISREEFDALKKDVEEMKKLLIRAKEYDRKNNEPDCEMDEKVALVKKIADLVGVSLDDVLKGA